MIAQTSSKDSSRPRSLSSRLLPSLFCLICCLLHSLILLLHLEIVLLGCEDFGNLVGEFSVILSVSILRVCCIIPLEDCEEILLKMIGPGFQVLGTGIKLVVQFKWS